METVVLKGVSPDVADDVALAISVYHDKRNASDQELRELQERLETVLMYTYHHFKDDEGSCMLMRHQRNAVAYFLLRMIAFETGRIPVAGGILADHMGLGKTRTTVAMMVGAKAAGALLHSRRCNSNSSSNSSGSSSTSIGANTNSGGANSSGSSGSNRHNGKTLCIVPKNTFHNWATELQTYARSLKVSFVASVKGAKRKTAMFSKDVDVVLVDAETLKSHDAVRWMLYEYDAKKRDYARDRPITWMQVCIDEAHIIRTKSTVTSKNAFAIGRHISYAVTATPIMNNDNEIRTLLEWVGYVRPGTREQLLQVTDDCMIQRNYDAAGIVLPPLRYDIVNCDTQREVRAVLDWIDDRLPTDATIAKIQLKRQVVLNLGVLRKNKEYYLQYLRDKAEYGLPDIPEGCDGDAFNAPIRKLMEHVGGHAHKAIVFTHFNNEVAAIKAGMDEIGVHTEQLTGDMDPAEKECALRSFIDGDARVLVANIKCGGTGLNLQVAKIVYFVSGDWNPAMELQSIARAWRLGQADAVRAVFIMQSDNEVEANIQAVQYGKVCNSMAIMPNSEHQNAVHLERLEAGRQIVDERRAAQATSGGGNNEGDSSSSDHSESDGDGTGSPRRALTPPRSVRPAVASCRKAAVGGFAGSATKRVRSAMSEPRGRSRIPSQTDGSSDSSSDSSGDEAAVPLRSGAVAHGKLGRGGSTFQQVKRRLFGDAADAIRASLQQRGGK